MAVHRRLDKKEKDEGTDLFGRVKMHVFIIGCVVTYSFPEEELFVYLFDAYFSKGHRASGYVFSERNNGIREKYSFFKVRQKDSKKVTLPKCEVVRRE